MATAITDTPVISDPVNVVLQRRFLARAKQLCTYYAGTQPSNHPLHAGSNTAKWRRYEQESPSTSALAELTGNVSFPTRDGVQPSITDISATVARYGQHYVLNEEVDLINPTTQDNELVDVMAEAGGRSMNRLMRNEMEDNSTQIRANGTADNAITSKLTRNNVRNVVNTLQRNSARRFTPDTTGSVNINTSPVRASFLGFCHVDVEQDVRDMAGFIDVVSYMGHTTTFPGEFGFVAGVRWVSTEEAGITANGGGSVGSTGLRSTGGSSIDLYESIVMGMSAVGSLGWGEEHVQEAYSAGDRIPALRLFQIPRQRSIVDPYAELAVIGYQFWVAPKITNGNWIRRLTSGDTSLS